MIKFINVIYIFILLLVFYSCKQENSDIGSEFLDIHTNVTCIDTVSVDISTVFLDSLVTSGKSTALCGYIEDGDFGKITANTYFQLQIPGSLEFTTDVIYDSIVLQLQSNGFVYGDTTKDYELSVHKLNQDLSDNDEGTYYNSTTFNYNEESLGSCKIKPRPHIVPNLSVKLSDNLGITLLNKILDDDDTITSQTEFLKYFKGLAVVASKNNSLIMGFTAADSSICLKLYYHQQGADNNTNVKFKLYNTEKQYNQINIDRSGTQLASLSSKNNEINSNITGNQSYMQCSAGIAIKFSFPHLKNLQFLSKYYSILRADLIVKPVRKLYDNTFKLPESMILYETDGSLSLGNYLTDSKGNSLTGELVTDMLYPENTQYSYDITSYIIKMLKNENTDNLGLLYISPNLSSSLERLVIGNQNNYENRTHLRLFYIRYNE